jgi:hypothetical protein
MIGLWFLTQALIGSRAAPAGGIDDGMHRLLAPAHDWLLIHELCADTLMIVSSAFIDGLAIFIILRSVLGQSLRPFLGLLMLFVLRQLCQALISLPEPHEMIWRYPGFPALLVTYGVATDLFFSGHTSVAVYGALELARIGRRWILPGLLIAVFEALTVLTLRAHYTMDVFAAALAAAVVSKAAEAIAPHGDRLVNRLWGRGGAT